MAFRVPRGARIARAEAWGRTARVRQNSYGGFVRRRLRLASDSMLPSSSPVRDVNTEPGTTRSWPRRCHADPTAGHEYSGPLLSSRDTSCERLRGFYSSGGDSDRSRRRSTAAGWPSTSFLCKSPPRVSRDICCRGRVERRGTLAREIAVTSSVVADWYCLSCPFFSHRDRRCIPSPVCPSRFYHETYHEPICNVSIALLWEAFFSKLSSLAIRLLCQVVFNVYIM